MALDKKDQLWVTFRAQNPDATGSQIDEMVRKRLEAEASVAQSSFREASRQAESDHIRDISEGYHSSDQAEREAAYDRRERYKQERDSGWGYN